MNFLINRFAELNVSDAVDGVISGQAADHTFTVSRTEESASVDSSVEGFQAGTYTVTVDGNEVEITIAEDGSVSYDGDLSALDGVTVSIPQADGDPIEITIVTSEAPMLIGTEDDDGNVTKLAAGSYTLVTDDYDPTDEDANIADYQWTLVVDADGHITSASGPDDATLEDIPDTLLTVPTDPTSTDAPDVTTTGVVSGTLSLNGVTYNVSLENGTYAISGGDVNYSGSSAEYSTEVTSVVGTYTISAGDSGVAVASTGTAEEVAIETIPGGNTATFANGVSVVTDDDGNILSVTGADDDSQSDSGILVVGDYTYNFALDGETASLTVDPDSIQPEEVNFADNDKVTTASVTISAGEYTLVFDLADGEATLVNATDASGNEYEINEDGSAFIVGDNEYAVSFAMDDPQSFESIVASYTVPGDASGTADYQSESVVSAATYTGTINSLGQEINVSFSVVDETSYTDENGITWTIDTENLSAVSDGGASTTGLGQIVGYEPAQNGAFTATGVVNAADVTVIGELDASGTLLSMTVNGQAVEGTDTVVLGLGGEYTVDYADGKVSFTNVMSDTQDSATFATVQEGKDALASGTAIAVGSYNLQIEDGKLTGTILNADMTAIVDSASDVTVDTSSNTYTFNGTTYAIESVSGTTVNLASGQGSVSLVEVDSINDLDQVGEYFTSAASNGTASGTFKVGATEYTLGVEYDAAGALAAGTLISGSDTTTLTADQVTALSSTDGLTIDGMTIKVASGALSDGALATSEVTVTADLTKTFADTADDMTDSISVTSTDNASTTLVTYKFDDTHYYAFLLGTDGKTFYQPTEEVTPTGQTTFTFSSSTYAYFSADNSTWEPVSGATFSKARLTFTNATTSSGLDVKAVGTLSVSGGASALTGNTLYSSLSTADYSAVTFVAGSNATLVSEALVDATAVADVSATNNITVSDGALTGEYTFQVSGGTTEGFSNSGTGSDTFTFTIGSISNVSIQENAVLGTNVNTLAANVTIGITTGGASTANNYYFKVYGLENATGGLAGFTTAVQMDSTFTTELGTNGNAQLSNTGVFQMGTYSNGNFKAGDTTSDYTIGFKSATDLVVETGNGETAGDGIVNASASAGTGNTLYNFTFSTAAAPFLGSTITTQFSTMMSTYGGSALSSSADALNALMGTNAGTAQLSTSNSSPISSSVSSTFDGITYYKFTVKNLGTTDSKGTNVSEYVSDDGNAIGSVGIVTTNSDAWTQFGSASKVEGELAIDSTGKPYINVKIEGKTQEATFNSNDDGSTAVKKPAIGALVWDEDGGATAASATIPYIGYWQTATDQATQTDVPNIEGQSVYVYSNVSSAMEKLTPGSINNPAKAISRTDAASGNNADLFATWVRAGDTEGTEYTTWRAMQYFSANSGDAKDVTIYTGNLSVSLSSGLVAVLPVSGGHIGSTESKGYLFGFAANNGANSGQYYALSTNDSYGSFGTADSLGLASFTLTTSVAAGVGTYGEIVTFTIGAGDDARNSYTAFFSTASGSSQYQAVALPTYAVGTNNETLMSAALSEGSWNTAQFGSLGIVYTGDPVVDDNLIDSSKIIGGTLADGANYYGLTKSQAAALYQLDNYYEYAVAKSQNDGSSIADNIFTALNEGATIDGESLTYTIGTTSSTVTFKATVTDTMGKTIAQMTSGYGDALSQFSSAYIAYQNNQKTYSNLFKNVGTLFEDAADTANSIELGTAASANSFTLKLISTPNFTADQITSISSDISTSSDLAKLLRGADGQLGTNNLFSMTFGTNTYYVVGSTVQNSTASSIYTATGAQWTTADSNYDPILDKVFTSMKFSTAAEGYTAQLGTTTIVLSTSGATVDIDSFFTEAAYSAKASLTSDAYTEARLAGDSATSVAKLGESTNYQGTIAIDFTGDTYYLSYTSDTALGFTVNGLFDNADASGTSLVTVTDNAFTFESGTYTVNAVSYSEITVAATGVLGNSLTTVDGDSATASVTTYYLDGQTTSPSDTSFSISNVNYEVKVTGSDVTITSETTSTSTLADYQGYDAQVNSGTWTFNGTTIGVDSTGVIENATFTIDGYDYSATYQDTNANGLVDSDDTVALIGKPNGTAATDVSVSNVVDPTAQVPGKLSIPVADTGYYVVTDSDSAVVGQVSEVYDNALGTGTAVAASTLNLEVSIVEDTNGDGILDLNIRDLASQTVNGEITSSTETGTVAGITVTKVNGEFTETSYTDEATGITYTYSGEGNTFNYSGSGSEVTVEGTVVEDATIINRTIEGVEFAGATLTITESGTSLEGLTLVNIEGADSYEDGVLTVDGVAYTVEQVDADSFNATIEDTDALNQSTETVSTPTLYRFSLEGNGESYTVGIVDGQVVDYSSGTAGDPIEATVNIEKTLTYNFNIGSDSASLDIVDADGETTASTETALESSNVYSFVDAAGETHEISDDDVIAGVVGEDGYVYTYTVTAAADEGSAPTVTAVRAEAQISYVITEDEDAEATTTLQDADGNDITTDTTTIYSAEIDGNVVTGTASEILSAVIAAEMTDGTIEITKTSDPITVDIDYTAASATLTADNGESSTIVDNAATLGDTTYNFDDELTTVTVGDADSSITITNGTFVVAGASDATLAHQNEDGTWTLDDDSYSLVNDTDEDIVLSGDAAGTLAAGDTYDPTTGEVSGEGKSVVKNSDGSIATSDGKFDNLNDDATASYDEDGNLTVTGMNGESTWTTPDGEVRNAAVSGDDDFSGVAQDGKLVSLGSVDDGATIRGGLEDVAVEADGDVAIAGDFAGSINGSALEVTGDSDGVVVSAADGALASVGGVSDGAAVTADVPVGIESGKVGASINGEEYDLTTENGATIDDGAITAEGPVTLGNGEYNLNGDDITVANDEDGVVVNGDEISGISDGAAVTSSDSDTTFKFDEGEVAASVNGKAYDVNDPAGASVEDGVLNVSDGATVGAADSVNAAGAVTLEDGFDGNVNGDDIEIAGDADGVVYEDGAISGVSDGASVTADDVPVTFDSGAVAAEVNGKAYDVNDPEGASVGTDGVLNVGENATVNAADSVKAADDVVLGNGFNGNVNGSDIAVSGDADGITAEIGENGAVDAISGLDSGATASVPAGTPVSTNGAGTVDLNGAEITTDDSNGLTLTPQADGVIAIDPESIADGAVIGGNATLAVGDATYAVNDDDSIKATEDGIKVYNASSQAADEARNNLTNDLATDGISVTPVADSDVSNALAESYDSATGTAKITADDLNGNNDLTLDTENTSGVEEIELDLSEMEVPVIIEDASPKNVDATMPNTGRSYAQIDQNVPAEALKQYAAGNPGNNAAGVQRRGDTFANFSKKADVRFTGGNGRDLFRSAGLKTRISGIGSNDSLNVTEGASLSGYNTNAFVMAPFANMANAIRNGAVKFLNKTRMNLNGGAANYDERGYMDKEYVASDDDVVFSGSSNTKGMFVNFMGDDGTTTLVGFNGAEGGVLDGTSTTIEGTKILVGNIQADETFNGSDIITSADDDVVLAGSLDTIELGNGGTDSLTLAHNNDIANGAVVDASSSNASGSVVIEGFTEGYGENADKVKGTAGYNFTARRDDDGLLNLVFGDLTLKFKGENNTDEEDYTEKAFQNDVATDGVFQFTGTDGTNDVYYAILDNDATVKVDNAYNEGVNYYGIGRDSLSSKLENGTFVDYTAYEETLSANLSTSIGGGSHYYNIESIKGGRSNSSLVGANDHNNALIAGAGATSIFGGGGRDSLFGYDGNDVEKRGSTEFFFIGGAGLDTVQGFDFGTEETADKINTFGQDATDFYLDTERNALMVQVGDNKNDMLQINGVTASSGKAQAVKVNASGTDFVVKLGADADYESGVNVYGDQKNTGNKLTVGSNITADKLAIYANSWDDSLNGGKIMYNVDNIDASAYAGTASLIGSENDSTLTGGTYKSSLWGGSSSNDLMIGGSGSDEFFYFIGDGNDTIQGATVDEENEDGQQDVVSLLGISLDDISSDSTYGESETVLRFNGGGSLTLTNMSGDVTFKLGGEDYTIDIENKTLKKKNGTTEE